MDKRKIIYYSDELNDEFSVTPLKKKDVGEDYIYVYNTSFKRFTHFFWYRVIAMPLAFAYTKFAFGHKIQNAKILVPYRDRGYFMYGNHTQDIGDALMPNMIEKCKDKYVIVNPANLSAHIVGPIVPSLGGLPLPNSIRATKNFFAAISQRIGEGNAVVIYPEAHIWPYYTGIRPFSDSSFFYPVKLSAPVFCFTNTYQKRKYSKKPRIVTYVDGPFFADESLPLRERRIKLRNEVYSKMCERAVLSDIKVIDYRKKECEND